MRGWWERGVVKGGRGVVTVGVPSREMLSRVERREKRGVRVGKWEMGTENFINSIIIFLLSNGRCKIHIGRCKIQVLLRNIHYISFIETRLKV